jgi:hypothetical protein
MKYVLCLGALLAPMLVAQDASTFNLTCSDIKLSPDNSTITATCKKRNGSPNRTSLKIMGVQNVDGKLTATGGESNYLKSCHTIRLKVPSKTDYYIKEVELTAICPKNSGHPSNTQLKLTNIENIDGVLKVTK